MNENGKGKPEDLRRVRVAILFGGQSDEHDVSLRSAKTVMDALDPELYDVVKIGITRDGQWLTQGDPHAQLIASSPVYEDSSGVWVSTEGVGYVEVRITDERTAR